MLGETLHGSRGPVRDPFSLQEVCEDRGHKRAPGNVVGRPEPLPPRHDRVTCLSERRCAPRAHRTSGTLVWEGRRTGRRAGRSGWWSEGPLHAPCAMAVPRSSRKLRHPEDVQNLHGSKPQSAIERLPAFRVPALALTTSNLGKTCRGYIRGWGQGPGSIGGHRACALCGVVGARAPGDAYAGWGHAVRPPAPIRTPGAARG